MSKKYRSDAMAAIHETMEALHKVGAIDKQTMRQFDDACLTPMQTLSPKQIKALREREHLSQTVFAGSPQPAHHRTDGCRRDVKSRMCGCDRPRSWSFSSLFTRIAQLS